MKRVDMMGLLPKGKRCVEVGVHKGQFSSQMLRILEPSELILVDAWKSFDDGISTEIMWTPEEWEAIHQKVLRRFAKNPEVRVIRATSVEASAMFADQSLDMVYIDAGHSYEDVKSDLNAWYPKIRSGGWLTGHDYDMKPVGKAVDEFLSGKSFNVTTGEKKYRSFYYQKP